LFGLDIYVALTLLFAFTSWFEWRSLHGLDVMTRISLEVNSVNVVGHSGYIGVYAYPIDLSNDVRGNMVDDDEDDSVWNEDMNLDSRTYTDSTSATGDDDQAKSESSNERERVLLEYFARNLLATDSDTDYEDSYHGTDQDSESNEEQVEFNQTRIQRDIHVELDGRTNQTNQLVEKVRAEIRTEIEMTKKENSMDDVCCVCLEPLSVKNGTDSDVIRNSTGKYFECIHNLHKECVFKLINSNDRPSAITCPLCRSRVRNAKDRNRQDEEVLECIERATANLRRSGNTEALVQQLGTLYDTYMQAPMPPEMDNTMEELTEPSCLDYLDYQVQRCKNFCCDSISDLCHFGCEICFVVLCFPCLGCAMIMP
jgi:hypothetical protein